MSKPKILQDGFSYTFRSYFEMSNDTDEILLEFGDEFMALPYLVIYTPLKSRLIAFNVGWALPLTPGKPIYW